MMLKKIVEDLYLYPVVCVAQRGHGKTTLIKKLVESAPQIVWKIFDVSQSWYHSAPVEYRMWVKPDSTYKPNVRNCVYELGQLSEADRRAFIAHIIGQDYDARYMGVFVNGPSEIEKIPLIVYVIEESNVIFNSYSLNKADEVGEVLRDFISVGRNYGLNGLFVTTASMGELSTRIRRRASLLMGQVLGRGELGAIRQRSNKETTEKVRLLKRFEFLYWNGSTSEAFKSGKYEGRTPSNYVIEKPEPIIQPIEAEDKSEHTEWPLPKIKHPTSRGWYLLAGVVVGVLLMVAWLISFLGF